MLYTKLYKPIIACFNSRYSLFPSRIPKYLFACAKNLYKEADILYLENVGNHIRIDSAMATRVTQTGHPTSAASIADILAVLFFHQEGLKIDVNNPKHFLNDRIILSKGHACPALYSAFYRAGIISQNDLFSLRRKDALLQGHPSPKIPFVDVATGALGQGLSVAVGIAYSSKYFDKIQNRAYCIIGDGECAQGAIWEAASFATYYKLSNLTLMIDANSFGESGQTMEGYQHYIYAEKFAAFGFNTIIIDGHQIKEIIKALAEAKKKHQKPTAIICKTVKGKNFCKKVQGYNHLHGKDLGDNFDESIKTLMKKVKPESIPLKTFPPAGDNILFQDLKVKITPNYKLTDIVSTRKAFGNGLLKARQSCDRVVGLDGDTKNSTFSITFAQKYPKSFIQCFIAEQNMVGVATGLACRKNIPFCSTFSAFLLRAADQIRIAGVSESHIKLVGSHGGVSIGEDGPSQMALQDLAFFRTLPKGVVLIPSDGVSTEKAVELAANYNEGPVFIRTSRPDTPILYKNDEPFELGKSKVVRSSANDKLVVISAAVTTQEAVKAWKTLHDEAISVRVLDIFSLKPIDVQGLKRNIEEVGGNVLVVEEHYPEGGVYEAVCGAVPTSIKRIEHLCVHRVPGSAKPEQQLQIHELDAKAIYKKIKQIILR